MIPGTASSSKQPVAQNLLGNRPNSSTIAANEFNRLSISNTCNECSSPDESSEPANNLDNMVHYYVPDAGTRTEANNLHPISAQPNYNWQSTKPTVKERVSFMYNNEILADIHFVVGRNPYTQTIPAHKFVLSVGSAVFDAMFNSTLATKSESIELPDIEPSAFLALLRFLYSDDVQIGPENVMTTLYTAKKYAVPALEKLCVEFLQRNLTPDNAFMLLSQARLFDESDLAALCLRMIDKSTSDAIVADGFTDIDLETLCVVLRRSSLRVKETKLFEAIVRWSTAECVRRELLVSPENQRMVLGSALSLIRFPLMTVVDFANGPAQSKILRDSEVVSLFLYFIVNPKPSIDFDDSPRSTVSGNELVIDRFYQIEMRWGYSGSCDRIRFIVDRPIYVIGFGLYGGIHKSSEYNVLIEIQHTASSNVLARNNVKYTCDGSSYIYRVLFVEPVQIYANTSYTASATIKGPDSYYGTKGGRKICVETEIGKVTCQFSYSSGNNNGTSVEDGQIPQILFYT